MKKNILLIFMAIMMIFTFSACGEASSEKEENTASIEATSELPTIDRAGNEIKVPENINSIISLAPSITEILVDLGLGDKIIAIDTNSIGLEGVKEDLPAFDLMNPDAEKLASLNPSIILVSGISMVNGENPFKPLIDLGISVICIPTSESIEAIREDITFIAQVTKTDEKGKEIINTMDAEIEKIASIGKTITDKKKVYFEISAAPSMYSFGSGTFLNEMIELVGGENVFADQQGWMSVEAEVAVNENPDVILTNVTYIENPIEEILSRSGWENMNAIKNKQVFYIDNYASSLANHNIVKALQQMAKAIYPDRY